MTHFEQEGLFLGLISYPFNRDGKSLYKDKLSAFFKKHKDGLAKYDISGIADSLYDPRAYRMFGSQGLAILALVDDYNFYNRHFNKNHIQTLLNDDDLIFNSIVISGVTEVDDSSCSGLMDKAKNTFLRKNDRYNYIGIIRLKINHELLLGKDNGIKTIRAIKSYIDVLEKQCKEKTQSNTDHIVVDCFDNDEITIISFSNDLLYLYNFLGEIRSITNNSINIECFDKDKNVVEKHVFGSALLCFGYDINHEISKDDTIKSFTMNCLIESKAGHRDSLYAYLQSNKEKFGISYVQKNITGGCNIIATFLLNNIELLEEKCCNDNVIERDVRKMKVVLLDVDCENRIMCQIDTNHADSNNNPKVQIKKGTIEKTKSIMKAAGISKLVRERMMALYEVYNNSCHNLLQKFYLKELEPTMLSFSKMVADMKSRNERIRDMEDTLNIEIGNMENAIYDRLYLQKSNHYPLEYSGGIHQYLTSFDYAYKTIVKAFHHNAKENKGYITITGAERASSTRNLFNLNINDIVFPELFITTAWKEVANFALNLFETPQDESTVTDDEFAKNFIKHMEIWQSYSQNSNAFNKLKYNIINSDKILPHDSTCQIVMDLLNQEMLMYFFKDYIVFHFAFQEDFELMWYFYFKTMLQTSICYTQLNELDRKHFIHMLLRLFVVGLLSDNDTHRSFIKKQADIPFDHIMGEMWINDYYKTLEIANMIYNNLDEYGFKTMNDDYVLYNENCISNLSVNDDAKKEVTARVMSRVSRATIMADNINNGALVAANNESQHNYIMCLFYAYLKVVYELDGYNKSIKSVPREPDGSIMDILDVKKNNDKSKNYYDESIGILIDPTGGFFIPSSNIRKKYFQIRTVLYRSLWNYRFTNSEN